MSERGKRKSVNPMERLNSQKAWGQDCRMAAVRRDVVEGLERLIGRR